MVGPLKFHNYMLIELQKDVENFKGGNLRYFSKNWYLKQLPTQNSRCSYPLSSKEYEVVSVEITKLLRKAVIVYSTPEKGIYFWYFH